MDINSRLDEKYLKCLIEAKKFIRVADHMASVTFGVVKDSKLFIAILENTFLALSNIIGAILYIERKYKNIPPFRDSFESKFNMFKLRIVDKFNIDKKYILLVQKVRDLILEHKNSPVEFKRKNEFVICDDNYKIKVLKLDDLKKIINEARSFINNIDIIIRNQDVFYRRFKK